MAATPRRARSSAVSAAAPSRRSSTARRSASSSPPRSTRPAGGEVVLTPGPHDRRRRSEAGGPRRSTGGDDRGRGLRAADAGRRSSSRGRLRRVPRPARDRDGPRLGGRPAAAVRRPRALARLLPRHPRRPGSSAARASLAVVCAPLRDWHSAASAGVGDAVNELVLHDRRRGRPEPDARAASARRSRPSWADVGVTLTRGRTRTCTESSTRTPRTTSSCSSVFAVLVLLGAAFARLQPHDPDRRGAAARDRHRHGARRAPARARDPPAAARRPDRAARRAARDRASACSPAASSAASSPTCCRCRSR